jgi:enoyl-CoA hydratase/carnithine racemase
VVRGAGRAFGSGIDLTAMSQGETGMTLKEITFDPSCSLSQRLIRLRWKLI